jgi:adenylate cyclase
MALGLYHSRAYEDAVETAEQAIRLFPEFPLPRRILAAALGQLGRVEGAKAALDIAIASAPDSFEMYVRQRVPWQRPEDHAHMLDGLRKAGWRET